MLRIIEVGDADVTLDEVEGQAPRIVSKTPHFDGADLPTDEQVRETDAYTGYVWESGRLF